MPYRLCTFDTFGKILTVSPVSYQDSMEPVIGAAAFAPANYAFIDETLLPSQEVIDGINENGEEPILLDGTDIRVRTNSTKDTMYDPTVEVTLFMPNPHPYITRGRLIVQDITKVQTVYNLFDPTTKPVHSATTYKFGPCSGKFTKSGTGYTGGYLCVTNLSKRNLGGYIAPHNNIGAGATHSYAVEMFFYPTSTASNFTLVQKGPTGASANWKLGFDSSAGQLQFVWQSYGTTGGYNYTQNIINTAGMTTNTWHHVAVALVRNGSGVCYQMSGYFNGVNKFTQSITGSATLPEVRYDGALYIGNNPAGTESFDGYIDSFRLLEAPSTGGVFGPSGYGFLPYGGGTLGVPTLSGFTRSAETAAIMNFNNLPDTSDFYVESLDFISGTVCRITNLVLGPSGPTSSASAEIGVKNIYRYTIGYTAGATGYSDATGFTTNYGVIAAPFASGFTTTSINHGYDYAYSLNDVYDNNPSLNVYQINYRNQSLYSYGLQLSSVIEGVSGNRGSSGSVYDTAYGTNPFGRLFVGNSYGSGHNSLFLNPLDKTTMNYIMDSGYLVTQGISQASYSFVDARGIGRTMSATEISNLRLDILQYQSNIKNRFRDAKTDITAATSKNGVKAAYNKTPTVINGLIPTLGVGDYGGGDLALD